MYQFDSFLPENMPFAKIQKHSEASEEGAKGIFPEFEFLPFNFLEENGLLMPYGTENYFNF